MQVNELLQTEWDYCRLCLAEPEDESFTILFDQHLKTCKALSEQYLEAV